MTRFVNCRMFSLGAMALALLVVSTSALAARELRKSHKQVAPLGVNAARNSNEVTHCGKVVSITGNKLVMTNKEGREYSHTLTADVKLTMDGNACKAADLKPGTRIRVTTSRANTSVANRIEGIDKTPEFANNCHDGKVVSITGNKLVMTNTQGKDKHTCTMTPDVEVTCDGKACNAADLKPGTRIRVTTQGADNRVANRIEAIDKSPEFASNHHDGKVVSVTGDKLVMTNSQGSEEQTCTLNADVKVTCDGTVCKSSDLKPGMKIRVTLESDEPHAATRVEALDKNPEFVSH